MKFLSQVAASRGLVRRNNEDSFLLLPEVGLFAVADGMGGHCDGHLASSLAIDHLNTSYGTTEGLDKFKHVYDTDRNNGKLCGEDSLELFMLRKSIEDANSKIFHASAGTEGTGSMGTTLSVMSITDLSRSWIANVGDSRIYRHRDGNLTQLTDDHSLLNEYLKLNLIKPEEAENFPMKNVIVRAIGLDDWVDVDTFPIEPRIGDRYLLCSDGLTDLVSNETISVVLDNDKLEDPASVLVELAIDAGGLDNVTAVVITLSE